WTVRFPVRRYEPDALIVTGNPDVSPEKQPGPVAQAWLISRTPSTAYALDAISSAMSVSPTTIRIALISLPQRIDEPWLAFPIRSRPGRPLPKAAILCRSARGVRAVRRVASRGAPHLRRRAA